VSKSLRALFASPEPPDRVVPVGFPGWLFCAAVFLVGILALASVQFSKTGLLAADAHYHVRVAKEISDAGMLEDFPWTQASVFKDNYADKQFLFHAILIPFLTDDLVFGPKLLTVVLSALLLALLAWMALRHGFPLPWLWVVLVLASGAMFLFRMNLTRPHLLAVPLSVLAAHLMIRRHVLGTFLVSMVFPLCYTAAHLIFCIALLYAASCCMKKEPFPWRLLLAVVAGSFAGLLLHPHRINIFHLWYLQNIQVMLNVWQIQDEVRMGAEFHSVPGRLILWDAIAVLAGWFGVILFFFLRGRKVSLRTLFFFLLSCGFLVMFLNIYRFVEYWVPFSVLFVASATRDLTEDFDARAWSSSHRIAGPVVFGLLFVLLAAQTTRSVLGAQSGVHQYHSPRYQSEARWIARHLPEGELVFTCDWDSFPYLFFYAPRQRYLVALDPTFMQAYDPGLFGLWRRIATGRESSNADKILARFGTCWVLAEKDQEYLPFIEKCRRDWRFLLTYNGTDAIVFAVLLNPAPAVQPLAEAGVAALIPGVYLPRQFLCYHAGIRRF